MADTPESPAATEPTQELIERVRGGDERALDRLLGRYLAPLQRWARGRLPAGARDLLGTDDLVQETLIRTMSRIGSFEARGPGSFQAYLRQALLNRIRDEARRRGRR